MTLQQFASKNRFSGNNSYTFMTTVIAGDVFSDSLSN